MVLPEDVLSREYVDYVVRGEGEESFYKFIKGDGHQPCGRAHKQGPCVCMLERVRTDYVGKGQGENLFYEFSIGDEVETITVLSYRDS